MRRFRINLSNWCYHLISRVAHHAYFFDEDERTRFVDFGRRVAEFAAAEIRIDEGWLAANRKGRAAMTRKTYCGNLLWQSSLTLLVPEAWRRAVRQEREAEVVYAEDPKLVKKYGIAGFPTALILDGDGNKVGETAGYRKGGAKAYAEHLLEIKRKQ